MKSCELSVHTAMPVASTSRGVPVYFPANHVYPRSDDDSAGCGELCGARIPLPIMLPTGPNMSTYAEQSYRDATKPNRQWSFNLYTKTDCRNSQHCQL